MESLGQLTEAELVANLERVVAEVAVRLRRVPAVREGKADGEKVTFSEWLREELRVRGLTAKELSSRTGIATSTLQNYTSGGTTSPSFQNVVAIANVFGVNLDDVASCITFS
jgi:lambda repressor-like predicted transcriptional regulator